MKEELKTIIKAYEIMSSEYKKLKEKNEFQVLSMIIVDGVLQETIYKNKMNEKNKSILGEHSERVAYEKNMGRKVMILVTIASCDNCYIKFIKDNDEIEAVYYLSRSLQENKQSMKSNDKKFICVEDLLIDHKSKFLEFKEKLLGDYSKRKLNNSKKKGKNLIREGGDVNGQRADKQKRIRKFLEAE